MLNLLKLKQEKAAEKGTGEAGAKSGGKVIPAAQRRVQKGIFSARLPCKHFMHTSSRWLCVSGLFDVDCGLCAPAKAFRSQEQTQP